MQDFDDTYSTEKIAELRRKEEEHLIEGLARQNGYGYIDLRGVTINPTALFIIPKEDAMQSEIVAFETIRKRISVALRNPNNPATKMALSDLETKGYTITVFMTSTASLEHAYKRYEDQKNTTAVVSGVLEINADNITAQIQKFKTPEMVKTHITEIRTVNNVRKISDTLESVFAGAIALKASDIHIEPEQNGIRLRYRLDGVLHDIMDIELSMYQRLM